ncbi:MAG: hypothetical protein AAGF98_11210 [Cyanobacteria bacterium P01_H01_bin.153]
MSEAMSYALSPSKVHTCIIVAALSQLEKNVAAARAFQALGAEALTDIESRTASV